MANIERDSHRSSTERAVRLTIRSSRINGKGLFSLDDIPRGQVIHEAQDYFVGAVPVYGSVQRTPSEHLLEKYLRWVNHSSASNCRLIFDGPAIKLVAVKAIQRESELLCDYEETEENIPVPFVCNCGHCGGKLMA